MTAPTRPDFATSPIEGVDFTQTYLISTSTPEYPAAPFSAGQIVLGTDGTEYMFAKSVVGNKAYECAAIDVTEALAVPATIALANAQQKLGWPQVAIPAGAFGWYALRGQGIGVLAKKGSLPFGVVGAAGNINDKLYVSSTSPGVLTTLSVRTSALVLGVTLTTSVTSAMTGANPSAVVVAVATWPRSPQ
jgi:hypothetical protein